MFGNRVLRRIPGPKRDEIIGNWRQLHNEELPNMYCLPDVIRMIQSRWMRWAGYMPAWDGGEEECIVAGSCELWVP
jgi:hypothetical protein